MTVTEDVPVATSASSEPPAPIPAAQGLAVLLGSGDHKVTGRLWMVASVVHLALAGVAALLVAAERIDLGGIDIVGSDDLLQYFSYRSIAGVFLFLLPLTIGLATTVVPLQVGASTIAFPRAAAAAAWTYLFAGGLLVGAYLIDGGPFGSDVDGVRLFVASFALVLIAQVVAWICIATTVISLRVPGLSMARTPLFSWSTLVAGSVWVLTLPVLAAVTVMSYVDIRYGGGNGFFAGGEGALYSRIAWAFSTPAVYVLAIPVLGFVGSVVPVFAQTRHQQHRVAQGLIGAFAVLAVGSWTLPGFGQDAFPWLYEVPWVAVSIAVLLPLLALFGLWAATARSGRIKLGSPLLYSVVAALMLLVGVLAGAVQAIEPIETLVDGEGTSLFGTAWSTGVASYVVLAAAIAMLGGVVYWAPKVIGRTLNEAGARLVAVVLLAGTVVWSLPDLVSGLLGQPGSPTLVPADNTGTIETLNLVATAGGAIVALGFAAFVALLVGAIRSDEAPGDDPWAGHTLEWATSSPPPHGNFASLPEVASEAPLYDARHRTEEGSA